MTERMRKRTKRHQRVEDLSVIQEVSPDAAALVVPDRRTSFAPPKASPSIILLTFNNCDCDSSGSNSFGRDSIFFGIFSCDSSVTSRLRSQNLFCDDSFDRLSSHNFSCDGSCSCNGFSSTASAAIASASTDLTPTDSAPTTSLAAASVATASATTASLRQTQL